MTIRATIRAENEMTLVRVDDGEDGSAPYIGADKYWYIDGVSTGIKAEGTDGDDGTPIVWKGSLASAPSNPVVDWCYRNTTDGKVYIYNGSAWVLMTQDGTAGADGHSPQVTAEKSGTTTTIKVDETTIATINDGATGATGAKGDTGEQGQDGYTPYIGQNGNWWINGQDTGHSAEGDDGHSPYVDDNTGTWWEWDASAVPPAYHDTEIEPQGPQGIQGVKGDDGVTYYTWVKYADTPNSGMSDNPTGKAYMGIAYNKTTSTESTSYSDYSWSLIKGDTGSQGVKGDTGATGNGISSISYYYETTTTQTAPSASSITGTTMPTLSATDKYLWQKEIIAYTSEPPQTTVMLLAVYGDKGSTGTSLSSTTRYYQLATSAPIKPTDNQHIPSDWENVEPVYTPGDTKNLYLCVQTVWSNGNITYSPVSLSSTYAATKQAYNSINSKGEQLVINGQATLQNNTNFSNFTYDGAKANSSGGSFTKTAGFGATLLSDDYFPVDPNNTYRVTTDAISSLGIGKLYLMPVFYDVDKREITANTHMYQNNSFTTLARELKNGDTVVYLTNISDWNVNTGTATYQRAFIFWNYTNSKGYTYPEKTYSRNYFYNLWTDSNVNKTNNTIKLSSPWNNGTFAAGTKVSQGSSGSAYKYRGWNGHAVPTTWTTRYGLIDGVDYSGTNIQEKFPPGTAFCRVGYLWNYQGYGNNEQIWVTNIMMFNDALIAAHSKNTIFHQTTQPTGGAYKVGDTWFDTDDGYKMYTYNGTTWVAEELGANAIADLAITNVKIANGTIQNAKIATIDAGKITTGTINADRIEANSLTIGKIATADREQILNSNVQVGGRNWLQKTGDLSQWYYNTTYVTGNDFNGSEVNLGHGAELSWSYVINSSYENLVFPYADAEDKQFTISFEAKVDVVGSGTLEYLHYTISGQATAGGSRTKWTGFNIYNNSTSTDHLDTEYKKFSRTLTINDALFTSGSGDVNFVYFSFCNYSLANISVRNIKLELGNKATDWTPAVEDAGDNVTTQIQNLTPKIFYAYSSSSNGGDNFSITNSDLQYVGEYTSMSSEQSLNYSDYTWGVNPSWASKYADNYIIPISGGGIKLISPDVSTYAGLTPIALAFYLGDIEQARIGYDSDLMNAYGVVASNIFAYGNGSGVRFDNSEQAVIAGGGRGRFTWEVRQNGHLSLKRL